MFFLRVFAEKYEKVKRNEYKVRDFFKDTITNFDVVEKGGWYEHKYELWGRQKIDRPKYEYEQFSILKYWLQAGWKQWRVTDPKNLDFLKQMRNAQKFGIFPILCNRI